MAEFVVNDLMQHLTLKRWLVFHTPDVINNYRTMFGTVGTSNLNKATKIYDATGFHEIKRYYQFVGMISFHHTYKTLSMSLFEAENMDDFLEGFNSLKEQNWQVSDINTIGALLQQVIDDKSKELASIIMNKVL
ncbi:hypothetical protein [Mucilaginibacter sp.]|jgi:hypothetical protein|uniref:hypothetical protein n=1 Tax=Mucilaginibacter sp. TaxID=1882438 RepID=UPI002B64BDDB|nr:hypothetical protein [Mucilaginibacter sp.]HTI59070.1 hypothetical protein [Mucilaginibacter sp.]